jgi:hypothetical protein
MLPNVRFALEKYLSTYRSAKRLRIKTKTRAAISETRAKRLDIALCKLLTDMMLPLWTRKWVER